MPLLLPLAGGSGTAASMPDVRLEIALDSAPLASPVWTDVTDDLRSANIRRGRSRELDRYQAGSMTVVLDNRQRQFDPTVDANVLPRKRIRLIADGQVQFDGYVDSWDLGYENPNEATVTVSATDGMKVLQSVDLPSSPFAVEALADGPTSWWRLGEPSDSTMIFDFIGSKHATVQGTPTFQQASIINKESGTGIKFDHADGDGAVVFGNRSVTRVPNQFPFSVETWIRVPDTTGERRYIWADAWSSSLADLASLNLSSNTGTSLGIPDGAVIFEATGRSVYSTTLVDDDAVHHIVGVAHTATDFRIYIDGVEETNVFSAGTGSVSSSQHSIVLGNLVPGGSVTGSFGLGGQVQDIVIYDDVALSAARVLAHYNAGASGAGKAWRDDLPGERAARILDHAGWPVGLRDLDTGESVLQSAAIANLTALEHLRKVAESEFGELLVTRDGEVRLVARVNLVNLDTDATFSDDGVDLPYSDLKPDFSDQLIRNRVTISRIDGTAQTVEDDTSIESFGTISYTRDGLLHDDDLLSVSAAEFILSEYKDPLLRFSEITIKPQRDSAIFPILLARELGDKILVERNPPGGGAAISQSVRIEGISHSITPKFWETRWALSPAYQDVCIFELDDGSGSAPCGLDDAALYL